MYTTASRVLMTRAALAGRGFHTTARRMADAPLAAKKPMGAFRGGYVVIHPRRRPISIREEDMVLFS